MRHLSSAVVSHQTSVSKKLLFKTLAAKYPIKNIGYIVFRPALQDPDVSAEIGPKHTNEEATGPMLFPIWTKG